MNVDDAGCADEGAHQHGEHRDQAASGDGSCRPFAIADATALSYCAPVPVFLSAEANEEWT